MSSYPTSLDTFVNPDPNDALNNVDPALRHAEQHGDLNDAVEALEAKVGIDSSNESGSLDYKVRNGGALRRTYQVTTQSLAVNGLDYGQTVDLTLPLGKGCTILKIETDYPAWVRIYSTAAARTADTGRAQTVDATGEHGVLLEVITVAGSLALNLAPAAICYNLEDTPGATVPVTVKNLDSQTRSITVTVTVVPFEG